MAYDASKAAEYNQLIQQGLSPAAAAAQAGIAENDFSYQINEIGTPASNPNYGKLESAGLNQPDRRGNTLVSADSDPELPALPTTGTSRVTTFSTYTTTSTEQVSGGGSTTIVSNRTIPTASSETYAAQANAKQAEADDFIKNNPSNFARRKQGLPLLSAEEAAARQAQLDTINDQQAQLYNASLDARDGTAPTVSTVPNTTTTTQTVTSGTAITRESVNYNNDEQLTQQTETYLESTTTIANSNSALQTPLNPASDPSQFPAYDNDGNLEPGFAINDETGETFYRGFGTTTNQAVTSPADYGSAYANAGVFDQLPVGQAANLNDPYYGLSPQQLESLGGADPTDPYIRARLGIPQLPSTTLLATPAIGTINTGVPLVDNALNFITGLFGGKPTSPAVTQTGTTTGSAVAVPDTAPVAQTAAQIIVQDTNLSQDKQVNLINIDSAQVEIDQANENIQINNRTLLANEEAQAEAQESQRQSLAIIEQNNLELADDNLPDSRRAELEANNAAQRDAILQNAAVIDEAQTNIDSATANIDQQQASIQQNQTVIEQNAAGFAANDGSLLIQDDGVPEAIADPADSLVEADPTLTILSEEETAALFDGVDPELVNSFVEAEAPEDVALDGELVEDVFVEAEVPEDVELDQEPVEDVFVEAEVPEDVELDGELVEDVFVEAEVPEDVELDGELVEDVFVEAEVPEDLAPEDDPFEATRLEAEQELNRQDLTLNATEVEPESDPFEAERLAAEQALNDEPVESLSPEDVNPEDDPFEATRLEAEQELNRQELSVEANEPEPAEDPYEQSRLDAEAGFNDEPIEFEPADVDPADDPFEASRLEAEQELNRQELSETATEAEPVGAEELGNDYGFTSDETEGADPPPLGEPEPVTLSDEEILARQNAGGLSDEEILARQEVTNNQSAAAFKARAKSQGTLQSRDKQPGNGDWRVRLSLAPYSDYLYNATGAGILAPLTATNGVIFPYTPNITTTYSADYEKYNLIHSNYRGLFYKSSSVGDLQIRGTFTAQDTREAAYMLAVIHFFRSVTKMFYGQDAERGTPPPLVYLSGYGDQQFSSHPCVVGQFNYSLPNEVDYIRTNGPNNFGPNMSNRQTPTATSPGGANFAGAIRLANALLNKGAIPQLPAANALRSSVNNTNECTYVPTKMEIDITLIPVQTRSQVSKQFSLKEFANGNLLKKGFW
jgi:hypothetical protein